MFHDNGKLVLKGSFFEERVRLEASIRFLVMGLGSK
jgi:hypothetical protein